MNTNTIPTKIAKSVAAAPDYKTTPIGGHMAVPAEIRMAIVVRGGTEGGNPTVDIQVNLLDPEDTSKVIGVALAMTTGNCIRGLAAIVKALD